MLTNDEVSVLAYSKWEAAGKPEGRSDQFWAEAFNELNYKKEDTVPYSEPLPTEAELAATADISTIEPGTAPSEVPDGAEQQFIATTSASEFAAAEDVETIDPGTAPSDYVEGAVTQTQPEAQAESALEEDPPVEAPDSQKTKEQLLEPENSDLKLP